MSIIHIQNQQLNLNDITFAEDEYNPGIRKGDYLRSQMFQQDVELMSKGKNDKIYENEEEYEDISQQITYQQIQQQKEQNKQSINKLPECKKSLSQTKQPSNIVFQKDQESNSQNQDSQKMESEMNLMFLKNPFVVIGFVSRFLYHLKQNLVFRRPDLLKKNQLMVINDRAARSFDEELNYNNRNQIQFQRSKFFCIRMLKKKILLLKKKLKKKWIPIVNYLNESYQKFQIKLQSIQIPVISPFSQWIFVWDIISMTMILLYSMYISFNLSFQNQFQVHSFEFFGKFIFVLNVFILCNMAFYEKGVYVESRKKIFNYFFNNFFFVEFLCLLAIFSQLGSLLQFSFFFKLFQYHKIVKKYKENYQINHKLNLVFQILILLVEIIQLCHFLCCAWYYIGYYQKSIQQPTWLDKITANTVSSIYIQSLYFCVISVTTIGYGDITAQNDVERLFIIFMSLFASGTFGYIVNTMSYILNEYYKIQQQFTNQLNDINCYMNQRDVSSQIQTRARNYLEYVYKEGYINFNKTQQALNSLNNNIREDIERDAYFKTLKQIEFLYQNFSKQFLLKLALKVKEVNYGPDEEIIKRSSNNNQQQPKLFCIIRGEVEIYIESACEKTQTEENIKSFCILQRNNYFGLDEFISQKYYNIYSARSRGVSHVQYVNIQDFLDTLSEFPKDREIYQNIKDNLVFYKAYEQTKQYCFSCKSSRHLLGMCHYIQYVAKNEKVINQFLKEDRKFNTKYKRKPKLRLNILSTLQKVQDQAIDIIETDLMDEYLANYYQENTSDDEEESEEESSRGSQIIRNFEELKQQAELKNQLLLDRKKSITVIPRLNAPPELAPDKIPLEIPEMEELQRPKKKLKKKAQKVTLDIEQFDEHKISFEELCKRYNTDLDKGLTEQQAIEKNKEQGDNILTVKQKQSLIIKFLKEISNTFAFLLWAGATLCFVAYGIDQSDPSNLYLGIILVSLVLISGTITFQQNVASEALMESFKSFLPSNSMVLRNGQVKIIPAAKLVCGDIINIKTGEKIPADIRIIQSSEMKVDNSALTGESEPQLRTKMCTHPQNPLETANLAFFGTLCKEGYGKGIVIRIGDGTILGQIASMTAQEESLSTPLRQELDRLVRYVLYLAIFLAILFFFLGWKVVGYPVITSILFGIGILVANVPEGLMGEVTICLAITAKILSEKNVLVKNLEAVETLGSTSCICTDKTGTLTQNIMTVENLWYNNQIFKALNKSLVDQSYNIEYDEQDPTFKALHKAAILSSEAKFDLSQEKDVLNIDYKKCSAIGDATETGIIRFYQYIQDIEQTRKQAILAKQPDGQDAKMPFNSTNKFALVVIQEIIENESDFCIYVKGAPEKIFTFCSYILINGRKEALGQHYIQEFDKINSFFGKQGQRVIGFAKLNLPKSSYPLQTSIFPVSSLEKYNFALEEFVFLGLISLIDPPKRRVPPAILECRAAGIKVIMVTGDQPPTAATIARQVNMIPKKVKTNIEIMEEENLDWETAAKKAEAIVVHGDYITKYMNKEISEKLQEFTYLKEWVRKPYCVFARTTPAQKLQIVKACQAEGYICAVTGDGVNDSPAIKQADIGISMNLSGSDVTKDSADMVLLDDDFASIVTGVEQGRKIFDNLKKATVYALTTNIPEIFPFAAFIFFQLPLPISSIFMIVLCIGTDVVPAISLGYEEAEIDVMTRQPRKKFEHLVSLKIIAHAYTLMGPIAFAGGCIAYFTTFNQLGFPINSLFGMVTMTGIHKPISGDFSDIGFCKNTYNHDCAFFNKAFMNPNSSSCMEDLENPKIKQWDVDWLSNEDASYDLRKGFIYCDKKTGLWTPKVEFSYCSKKNSISPISNVTVCYTTEALKYAQSAWLISVIFFQLSNVVACKSRRLSYCLSPFNLLMLIGAITEVAIGVILLYVPGVQTVFGGRPLTFWQFAMPSLPFSILLLLWEEIRKFLIRKYWWFEKYCFW